MGKSVLTVVLCLLLGGAALLAGCGGGGGGDSAAESAEEAAGSSREGEAGAGGGGGGEPPAEGTGSNLKPTSESKREFVKKATAVCKKQQKAMQAQARKFIKNASRTFVKVNQRRFVERVLAPGLEAEASALRELGAPQGEEEQVEAVIAAVGLMAEKARRDPPSYFENAAVFKEAAKVPAAYGLNACGAIG